MFKANKISAAIAAMVMMSGTAYAEEFTLEEVIVTAQKRAQTANDIGVAVSAFSGDDIRELGLDNATDLAASTPGLSTANAMSEGIPIFAVRGIGLDDYNSNNTGGVGVYVDEVFVSSPVMMSFQMFDVERVEVLKGPQGTLYGRNTTGGAINFVGRKPSEEFEAYIDADYSRFDRAEVTAAVGGELADGVRGRIATNIVNQSKGWQEDAVTGDDYGMADKWTLRAQLAIDISDDTDILLNLHGGEDNSEPSSWQADDNLLNGGDFGLYNYVATLVDGATATSPQGFNYPVASPGTPRDAAIISAPGSIHNFSSIGGPATPERDDETWGAAVTVNTDLGFASLTSITAYDKYSRDDAEYYDGSPAAVNDTWFTSDIEAFSQEFRLVSNSDGDFIWIAGLGYGKDKVESLDTALISAGIDAATALGCDLGGFWGLNLVSGACEATTAADFTPSLSAAGVTNAADGHFDTSLSPSALGVPAIVSTQYKQDTESLGLYLHTEWQFHDELKLTTGIRYSYEDRTFDGRTIDGAGQAVGFLNAAGQPDFILASLDESTDEDNVSGKIALDWTPNDDWLLYASVATGFKSGVYFASPVADPVGLAYVDPEEITAFEVGFKATLLDNTMQLNGAAFRYQYDDKQAVTTVLTPNGITATLANLPEAEIDGFELDLTWLPLQGLDVKAGVAYLNSKVTKGIENVRGVPLLTGPIESGEELSMAPEWSYNLLVKYEWELTGDLVATAAMDYSWSDDKASLVADANGRTGQQKDLGLRVGLSPLDGSWELALWGKNLEDENEVSYGYTNFDFDRSYSMQMPRTYGVSFTYNWQ